MLTSYVFILVLVSLVYSVVLFGKQLENFGGGGEWKLFTVLMEMIAYYFIYLFFQVHYLSFLKKF